MRNIESARKALKTVGFEILYEEDLAERESMSSGCGPCATFFSPTTKLRKLIGSGPDAVQWYYPLEGDLRKAQTVWDSESPFFTLSILITGRMNAPQAACRCGKAHA